MKQTDSTVPAQNLQGTTYNRSEHNYLVERHQSFLKKFKTFPSKTRKVIYKELLMIPMNYQHFQELSKPYKMLPEHNLNKEVSFICQCLCKLYPELQNQWTPGMIHPFVKLFSQDCVFSFECCLTMLLNYLFPVVHEYPAPNKKIMEIFEKGLPALTKRVNQLEYPLSSVINPMFVITLTDVLNRQDWLQVFDSLVVHSSRPWLYLCVSLAIVKSVEKRLVSYSSIEEIAMALRRQKNLCIRDILTSAEQIEELYRKQLVEMYSQRYFPVCANRYPVYSFIKQKLRLENQKMNVESQEDIDRLQHKFSRLEKLINNNLQSGMAADQKHIMDRYELVEGQMRTYLQTIKQEHSNKMQAIREVESNFNRQLTSQGKNRELQQALQAIERRTKLQKQIQHMISEAESIKQMEQDMLDRLKDSASIQKRQLLDQTNRY